MAVVSIANSISGSTSLVSSWYLVICYSHSVRKRMPSLVYLLFTAFIEIQFCRHFNGSTFFFLHPNLYGSRILVAMQYLRRFFRFYESNSSYPLHLNTQWFGLFNKFTFLNPFFSRNYHYVVRYSYTRCYAPSYSYINIYNIARLILNDK